MRYGLDETYTFLHLTFQEYLAAVHIAGLSKYQQIDIIKTHQDNRHLSVVWKFFCGMMNFTNADAIDTFVNLMRTTEDKLFHMQCCYESHRSLPCTHVISSVDGRVEFNTVNLSPSDCAAIGYTVNKSDSQTVHLIFNECNFRSEGAIALIQEVGNHPFSLTHK